MTLIINLLHGRHADSPIPETVFYFRFRKMSEVAVKLLQILALFGLSAKLQGTCNTSGHCEAYLRSSKQNQCFKNTIKQLLKFKQWDFASDQILINSFPIDPVRQNYVREVQNVLFSVVYPKPLKGQPLLAAVSEIVVMHIMDLDPFHINNTKFANFASGNMIMPGTEPLSHRYIYFILQCVELEW